MKMSLTCRVTNRTQDLEDRSAKMFLTEGYEAKKYPGLSLQLKNLSEEEFQRLEPGVFVAVTLEILDDNIANIDE